jgi:hypothetical protein
MFAAKKERRAAETPPSSERDIIAKAIEVAEQVINGEIDREYRSAPGVPREVIAQMLHAKAGNKFDLALWLLDQGK